MTAAVPSCSCSSLGISQSLVYYSPEILYKIRLELYDLCIRSGSLHFPFPILTMSTIHWLTYLYSHTQYLETQNFKDRINANISYCVLAVSQLQLHLNKWSWLANSCIWHPCLPESIRRLGCKIFLVNYFSKYCYIYISDFCGLLNVVLFRKSSNCYF